MIETCNASPHRAVMSGSCVMIQDSEIVYAGSLVTAPDAAGKMVLLSPDDFDRISEDLDRRRH